jgi:hypothetical protein
MGRLEDLFFFKADREIIKAYRQIQKLKETKAVLSKASGITDEIVLEKLVELNVRPEEAASISVVPLVVVAWVDGNIDAEEKKSILLSVTKLGWTKNSFDYGLLERWLEHKPSASLLDAWIHYVEGLCRQMTGPEIQHFKNEIISHAKIVAKASGGVFGLGKISDSESKVLNRLESAFKVCKL